MSSKPKILSLVPLPPPVHGSALVGQYLMDSSLLNGAFEMDFVNLSTSRSIGDIGNMSFALCCKKALRSLWSFFKTFGKLLTKRYDLCYLAITCHGVGFLKDAPFVLLCKLFGRKVVIHQHNKGMSADINRWPYRWLLPLVYRNAEVILLSWRLYPDIEKVVRKEHVLLCPNGVPQLEENKEIQRTKSQNSVPRLLYLSNLLVSKGVYVFLDAIKLLKDKGLDFYCDFVGGESKEISCADFEKAIKDRDLGGRVRYCGPHYGGEKEVFWNNSEIFILPTLNDCFPLVLVEAMQHGIVCVSTHEGGIPDILTDGVTGLMSEKQNAADLAEKIERLLLDPEMRRIMGDAGHRKYEENFTIEIFEKRFAECLNCAING